MPDADAKTLIENKMPSGDSFWSRDSDHSYWGDVTRKADGTVKSGTDRFTGVSTASKIVDLGKDGLMNWAANLTCDGAAILLDGILTRVGDGAHLADELAHLTDGAGIRDALAEQELTWKQLRSQAASRGTNVHEKFLAALARGDKPPSLADATPDERGYAQAVMAFWRDHSIEAKLVEQPICARSLKLAGRPDLICDLDGTSTLLDLKTGSFDAMADHLQVEAYELCARESGYGSTEQRVILRVDEWAGYKLLPSVADEAAERVGLDNGIEAFKHGLQAFRLARAMQNISMQRKRKASK